MAAACQVSPFVFASAKMGQKMGQAMNPPRTVQQIVSSDFACLQCEFIQCLADLFTGP
jgi:hypothetical protein